MKIDEMFVPRKKRNEDTDVVKNILLNGDCIGVLGSRLYEGFVVFDRDILKAHTGKYDYPKWSDIDDENKLPDINKDIFRKAMDELRSEDYYLEEITAYSQKYYHYTSRSERYDVYDVYYIEGNFEE